MRSVNHLLLSLSLSLQYIHKDVCGLLCFFFFSFSKKKKNSVGSWLVDPHRSLEIFQINECDCQSGREKLTREESESLSAGLTGPISVA